MFSKFSTLTIEIFNDAGTLFIGEAKFELPKESEEALLQLINYGVTPQTLMLQDLDFYRPSGVFIAPDISKPLRQSGIIKGILTDSANGFEVPVEISLNYDAIARHSGANPYFFDSVQFYNIAIKSIKALLP